MDYKVKNWLRHAKSDALKVGRLIIAALVCTAVFWLCAQLWKLLNSLA